jgi:hypothetical protein
VIYIYSSKFGHSDVSLELGVFIFSIFLTYQLPEYSKVSASEVSSIHLKDILNPNHEII